MATNRRAGIIYVKLDGQLLEAKGEFTYNLGLPVRTPIVGSDGIHGYSEAPQVAFIEGATTDSDELRLSDLVTKDGVTVTLELNNGKTIVLSNAWFAGEGSGTTTEGEIAVRFESRTPAEEM